MRSTLFRQSCTISLLLLLLSTVMLPLSNCYYYEEEEYEPNEKEWIDIFVWCVVREWVSHTSIIKQFCMKGRGVWRCCYIKRLAYLPLFLFSKNFKISTFCDCKTCPVWLPAPNITNISRAKIWFMLGYPIRFEQAYLLSKWICQRLFLNLEGI